MCSSVRRIAKRDRVWQSEFAGERLGGPSLVGELSAVIEGDGLDGIRKVRHHVDDGFRDGFLSASAHRTAGQKACSAIDQGDAPT